MKAIFSIGLIITIFTSCSSTRIVNNWRDPDTSINPVNLNKFVVAALLKNQAVRRQVEDQMASFVPGKAIPSYKEFGTNELKENDETYNQKLKAEGFDGFVIMRIASIDSSRRFVSGNYPTYYGNWRRYWGVSWSGFYEPSYYTTEQTYNIEVTVYSLKSDKLIWSGTSTAVNPSGDSSPYNDVSKEVYKKMKNEKFIL